MSTVKLLSIAKKIAIVGGIGTFVAINTIPYVLNEKIRKSDHYKKAIKLLNEHSEAIKYLGEPIKIGRVNVTNEDDYGTDGHIVWIVVPVRGSNDNGKLYYEFYMNEDNQQIVSRVELKLNNVKDYKLQIKTDQI